MQSIEDWEYAQYAHAYMASARGEPYVSKFDPENPLDDFSIRVDVDGSEGGDFLMSVPVGKGREFQKLIRHLKQLAEDGADAQSLLNPDVEPDAEAEDLFPHTRELDGILIETGQLLLDGGDFDDAGLCESDENCPICEGKHALPDGENWISPKDSDLHVDPQGRTYGVTRDHHWTLRAGQKVTLRENWDSTFHLAELLVGMDGIEAEVEGLKFDSDNFIEFCQIKFLHSQVFAFQLKKNLANKIFG